VGDVFRREPALEVFLTNPAIGRDRKAALLKQTFEGRCGELLFDFLNVLNAHDRMDVLRGVADVYRDLVDRGENRMQVRVRSEVPHPRPPGRTTGANVCGVIGASRSAGSPSCTLPSTPTSWAAGWYRGRTGSTTPASGPAWTYSANNSSREAAMRFKADEIVS